MLGGVFVFGFGWVGVGMGVGKVPLLDFVEALKERAGDEDYDCFFAVADFDLWGLEGCC